jgi:hypothetical protein
VKAKINELETNSKIKNIWKLYRGIEDFKKGYQPENNIVKYEKRDLITDSYCITGRWRNHFSQLLNIRRVNDVIQRKIHTADLLVPQPSAFEF